MVEPSFLAETCTPSSFWPEAEVIEPVSNWSAEAVLAAPTRTTLATLANNWHRKFVMMFLSSSRLLGQRIGALERWLGAGIDAARNAGIDRDLHQHFTDFVLGDAVAQCAFDMQLQLVRPIEDADHRDVEHAANLVRKAVAAPCGAPAILGDEFLKGAIEIVGILHRRLDVIFAEHSGANLKTLVEPGFVHGGFLV